MLPLPSGCSCMARWVQLVHGKVNDKVERKKKNDLSKGDQ